MTCYNCGSTIAEGSSHCSQCGQVFQSSQNKSTANSNTCPSCNQENTVNADFCAHCGTKLSLPQVMAPPQNNTQYYSPPAAPYYPPLNTEAPTKMSHYFLWFFLISIPVVGFICSIVFAIDSSKKNRSNFFRAALLFMVIAFAVGFVIGSIFLGLIGMAAEELLEYDINNLYDYLYIITAK